MLNALRFQRNSLNPVASQKRISTPINNSQDSISENSLGITTGDSSQEATIIIQTTEPVAKNVPTEVELVVDSVVGPEEVVIRPLPSLLMSQSLFSGVTLSGAGAIMLLVDPRQLIESSKLKQFSTPSAERTNSKHKILVVDDSLSSRRAMVHKLSRLQSMEIEQACDGAEALQLLLSSSFDAVFTDIDMPRMTGFDLLEEINSNENIHNIPVTVVSGRADEPSKTRANNLGATAYLLKPTSDSAVMTALQEMKILEHAIAW